MIYILVNSGIVDYTCCGIVLHSVSLKFIPVLFFFGGNILCGFEKPWVYVTDELWFMAGLTFDLAPDGDRFGQRRPPLYTIIANIYTARLSKWTNIQG